MQMKKLSLSLFFGTLLGLSAVSLPSYADDIVTFEIDSDTSYCTVYQSFYNGGQCTQRHYYQLSSDNFPLVKIDGSKLLFGPWINTYSKDTKIASSAAQTQTGTVTLMDSDEGFVLCKGQWTHQFWMENDHKKHDRFKLVVTQGPCYSTTPYDDSLHKSGSRVGFYVNLPQTKTTTYY